MSGEGSPNAVFKILIFVGAVLGVASVFTTWLSFELGVYTEHITGWDMIKNIWYDGEISNEPIVYMSAAILVFSIIALAGAVSLIMSSRRKKGTLVIISGAIITASAILFSMYTISNEVVRIEFMDFLGVGIYLATTTGMLIFIGGVGVSR
jgi:hypothetical protein